MGDPKYPYESLKIRSLKMVNRPEFKMKHDLVFLQGTITYHTFGKGKSSSKDFNNASQEGIC